jgi:hypothetical protein
MRGLSRLFLYLRYFFEPKDKLVRQLAYEAAKAHYAKLPLRSPQNPFPRVPEYNRRREEFLAFQRAYSNSYRHSYAKEKLGRI